MSEQDMTMTSRKTTNPATGSCVPRRQFLQCAALASGAALGVHACASVQPKAPAGDQPNILFAIADDWSWPYASVFGEPEVRTPTFDRVAREGMLFRNAFTAAPQCSPNRAATLTGRNIWQLEEAGTHGSIFPNKFPVFTDLLEGAGYHVGFTQKGWGPGDWQRGGWSRNPAGPEYSAHKLDSVPFDGISKTDYAANFDAFLEARPEGAPFFFWFGASEPHRRYEQGSGLKQGKDPSRVRVPAFLPDDPVVRADMLDYFVEIEWFDRQLGAMLQRLEALGELDNTLVVVSSDNGMPFPRAKANVYEYGTHVPLALRWGKEITGGRQTGALVSFIDFAPTVLQVAGVPVPESVTGASFASLLRSEEGGPRAYVLTGRERHTHARYDNLGYPSRAIRTDEYLYIRNFKPDRWPAGDPPEYHDIDGSPTKSLLLEKRQAYAQYFDAAVGKRPGEELFAVVGDPACLRNLADEPAYQEVKTRLNARLEQLLTKQGDPRVLGTGDIFESYPRVSGMRPELGGFAERGEYNPKYAPSSKR